ncbi:MAG: GNAT family N-acetyltransferase [Bacteroidia bacterium]
MLILKQYGVKLKRVTENEIEMLRIWRNSVSEYMEYRTHITPEAQKEWFKTIDNKSNYYFIIEFEGKDVGLINAKNYDPEMGFGEGGIFIAEKEYINSFAAVFATLCMLNFMLVKLNVCKVSRIRILRTNERAIQYNQLLGYKLMPAQENVLNQLYELHVDDYLKMGSKLNKAAAALSDGNNELSWEGEISEKNMDAINRLLGTDNE